jgi:hypothetical protein
VYRLLALCARAECGPALYRRLAQEAARLADWAGLPALAEAHGMAPLLHTHLKAAGITPPLAVKRKLQALYLRHRQAGRVQAHILRDVVAAYAAADIQALVVKGAALAHLVYPDPALRPMSDLDLLVPKSELEHAREVLAGLGFSAPAFGDALPHRHLAAATLQAEGVTIQIEIHHRLLSDYRDHAMAYVRSFLPGAKACARSRPAQIDGLTLPPRPFALGDLTAYTLSHEDMLAHLCRHLVSHVNVWDYARLIWVADIVSLSERFVREIDWERVRRQSPLVLDTLSLLHWMTPLPDELIAAAGVRIGCAPRGIGVEYAGWPRVRGAKVRDTLFPAEWWLRLRYRLGSVRPLSWCRWVRHPLYILGHVARVLLERLGWPTPDELVEGKRR